MFLKVCTTIQKSVAEKISADGLFKNKITSELRAQSEGQRLPEAHSRASFQRWSAL